MNEHLPMLNTASTINKIRHHESALIHLIRERLGIVIHSHQKQELEKVIIEACYKFNMEPNDYIDSLTKANENSPLIEHLVMGITIGETYFFRDNNQMRLLQEQILPDLIKRKRKENNLNLRIWSAGSSSGEEIYTIAMLLCDMLPDIKAWTISLLGTDINTTVLKKALAGTYTPWSMRAIPERYKQRYFTPQSGNFQLAPTIRNMVNFLYLNLNSNTFPSILNDTNAQDLIICRNVLIYFDREHGAELMKKLHRALVPEGLLILGASDPVYATQHDFVFDFKQGAIFKKSDGVKKSKQEKTHIPLQPDIKVNVVPEKPKEHLPKIATVQQASHPTFSLEERKQQIELLTREARWQDILDIMQANRKELARSAFFLSAHGTALANLGKLEEAVSICSQSIAIDSTNINTHFTLAMVLVELNRLKEAESELRKTLFLDHQFVMGHFQLGLLLIRNSQRAMGLKCLRNALAIAKAHDASQVLNASQSMDYGHLAEILEHEIELYAGKDASHDKA